MIIIIIVKWLKMLAMKCWKYGYDWREIFRKKSNFFVLNNPLGVDMPLN